MEVKINLHFQRINTKWLLLSVLRILRKIFNIQRD